MKRIAILRCEKLPSFVTWQIPNMEELFEEDILLQRGFESQGFEASSVVWNDPGIDWNEFDIALIRSTWDYLDERERFLDVLSRVEASSCRLFNPLRAIQWNIDKHYLFDLEKWGVSIIPTSLASELEQDNPPEFPSDWQAETVVLKPAIGLGGSHSHRVQLDELSHKLKDLKVSQPDQEFLVQPFMDGILSEGEWSFIYFNRRLSHTLLKKPAQGDYRVQGIYGGTIIRADPKKSDLLQAQSVMDKIPFDVLYARLDFVRMEGHLAVMEIELVEPIFSFNLVPESIPRLVDATRVKFKAYP